jgi:hypothetical protein
MADQKHIRLELTEEQKAQVKAATGKDAGAIELNAVELEERIAPRPSGPRAKSLLLKHFRPLLPLDRWEGALDLTRAG